MDLFNNMMGKLTQAKQNTVKWVKDYSETSRLNVEITNSEKQILDLYKEIGAKIYELYHASPIPEVADQFAKIDALFSNIDIIREQIKTINAEGTCPSCGAKINKDVPFCSSCGYKLAVAAPEAAPAPAPQPAVCANCGATLQENALFCNACGTKVQ